MSADDNMTVEQFLEHSKKYEAQGRYFHLIEGQIFEVPMFSRLQSHIVTQLFARLNYHVDTHLGGAVYDLKQAYILPDDTILRPTLSYVAFDRVQKNADHHIDGIPDLAIYLVDERVATDHITQKTQLCLDHGAQMVWVIFADESCAELYTHTDSNLQVEELGFGDMLTAPDILPDFELPLYTIFPLKQM